jgi:hypothetical protein
MTTTRPAPAGKLCSLATLSDIELSERHGRMLGLATESMQGSEAWKARKALEAHDLLALAECAGSSRMEVLTLDLQADLRTVVKLHVPVALTPGANGEIRLADEAVIGIAYPHLILNVPLPGFAAVSLLYPTGVHYPNIGNARGQRLCLGPNLPMGIPVSELILASYGVLTLQEAQMDPADSAGVMNVEAALFWQSNQQHIPLTKEPFLRPRNA